MFGPWNDIPQGQEGNKKTAVIGHHHILGKIKLLFLVTQVYGKGQFPGVRLATGD